MENRCLTWLTLSVTVRTVDNENIAGLQLIVPEEGEELLMKMELIYPRWPKLDRQTEFHLPPHGPVVFAAAVPEEVEINFTDENLADHRF